MTYITNIFRALFGIPYEVIKIKEVIKRYPYEVEKIVIKKDPHGLIKNDLATIQKLMHRKPYKVGDSIELVAYKAAQKNLYQAIVKHIIAPKQTLI